MILVEDEHKCKECKWLTGKRTSVGVECMQPDKQKKVEQDTNAMDGRIPQKCCEI